MSDSSNAYRIKPLEGAQGYPTWATKIMDILTELNYDKYITRSCCDKPIIPNQTDTAAIAALTEWERKQRKALTVVCLRVAEGPMAYIQRAITGVEAWNKLQSVYQPKAAINIIRLRRQIFRMACEGENVEENLRKLTDVKGTLEEYGTTISEVEFAITILMSFPDLWDTWVGGIDLASIKTSDDIITCIFQQAICPAAKPNSNDTALLAHSRSSSSNHCEGACFHCRCPSH
ncbi:polyprotein [Mycena venus]|uniref:Polyprotein n=1 Tax=Mycena venus TaxID=2733690 RepID=A0A8H6Z2X0_9AGAR|nr:polyprotein [Mycena venus]